MQNLADVEAGGFCSWALPHLVTKLDASAFMLGQQHCQGCEQRSHSCLCFRRCRCCPRKVRGQLRKLLKDGLQSLGRHQRLDACRAAIDGACQSPEGLCQNLPKRYPHHRCTQCQSLVCIIIGCCDMHSGAGLVLEAQCRGCVFPSKLVTCCELLQSGLKRVFGKCCCPGGKLDRPSCFPWCQSKPLHALRMQTSGQYCTIFDSFLSPGFLRSLAFSALAFAALVFPALAVSWQ